MSRKLEARIIKKLTSTCWKSDKDIKAMNLSQYLFKKNSKSSSNSNIKSWRTQGEFNSNSVQYRSVAQWCPTLWDPMNCSTPGSLSITNFRSLLKLMPIELVMPSSHLILCRPLLLLPPILPSIRVFSNESTLHMRWPKYWSFSFSVSPSNEHPGLISFRMYWLDLLAVQGTLKSLLQHHSSKASIFGAQLSSQSNSHIHTWPLEKL